MKLIRFDQSKLTKSYGINLFNEINSANSFGATFFPSFCQVDIGGQTLSHSHFETEVFLILKGEALAVVNGEEFKLGVNDQLIIHPFEEHVIKNISNESLEFYSVYSRVNDNKQQGNTLILSAPPTPNGRLHLGHISGPYLSADILKRFLSLKGKSAKHFSGTDDFQTYTYKLASDLNTSVKKLVDDFHQGISNDLQGANIIVDNFISPMRNIDYQNFVKDKFSKLKQSRHVSEEQVSFPYEKRFLYEAFLKGVCPSCDTPMAGHCCENCGYVGEAVEISSSSTSVENKTALVLDLSSFSGFLKEYHTQLNLEGEIALRAKRWRDNLKSFTLTNPDEIGLGGIHVWCEMALGLLFQVEQYPEDISELIYCFGIDNAYYYLVLVPIILNILEEEKYLPNKVVVNKFYHLEGSKFSTSRNHALWARDVAKKDWSFLRAYLAISRSEKKIGNYSHSEFLNFSSELEKKMNELKEIEKINFDYGLLGEQGKSFYERAVKKLLRVESSLSDLVSLNTYAEVALDLLDEYLIYFDTSDESKEAKASFVTLINMALQPLMPEIIKPEVFGSTWSLDLRSSSDE